ncbi:MAG: hypothetical protein JNJ77_10160 [Planctomycetia bacterium]|nr:hypothetical protein [Planctomycetia bacterium]
MDELLFEDSRLSEELDSRVRSDLRQGEKLLWVGQPRPGRLSRQAWPIVLFGIPWTAFALFWMAMASGFIFLGNQNPQPAGQGFDIFRWFFPLFGLPFVLVGLGMLSSPYWFTRRARKTCYAVTTQRAIIWQAGWFGSMEIRSFAPAELNRIRRVEYANGEGDLIFEDLLTMAHFERSRHQTSMRAGFMGISNVKKIEELITKALLHPSNETPQSENTSQQ